MREKIIIPLLFVFASAVFFYPMFLKGQLPIPADTIVSMYHPFLDTKSSEGVSFNNSLITDPVRQQYPWRELAISLFKQGQLPLWNPYTFSGTPLFANFQTAAFYPLNIVFIPFSFEIAWSILIFLQPLMAGIFLYLYLRNLQISPHASFLGGITFAFCGFMTAWLEWGNLGHTALWLPLILLCIDHLFTSSKKIIWSILFIFSLSASLFAGHLQTFSYVMLLSTLYFFARWVQLGKKLHILFLILILVCIAVLITAIQWWPTLLFVLQSAREADQVNNWTNPGWFVPWQHLIQFIAPDFFGNPTTLNYWGVWNYGEFIGYVGIIPLVMAFTALYVRRDMKTFFFGAVFVLSLLFSLPTYFAQLPYMMDIPFLSTAQPTRLLFITDFCLAVLAAFGMDMILKIKEKRRMFYCIGLFAVVFASVWMFVLWFGSTYVSSDFLNIAKRNLILPSIILTATSILLTLLLIRKQTQFRFLPTVVIVCLIVITVADLFRFFHKFNTFSDPRLLFPQSKIITYMQNQQGEFRVMADSNELLPSNFSTMYRLQTIEGYDPLYLLQYGEYASAMRKNEPDVSTPFSFNRIITSHNLESPLVDLVGVKYILSMHELKDISLEKKMVEGKTILYENKEAFPRVFLVENVLSVETKQHAIDRLYDKRVDLRRQAVVEDWDASTNRFGKGSVNIVEYSENIVGIETVTEDNGFLVLMDAYYPSWHVEICKDKDSECSETKIYRTNYAFRGVMVPKGKHYVRFSISLF